MGHFEYNLKNSKSNEKRHGIDFIRTQKLWDSTHVIIPAKNVKGERRYLILGKIREKCYAAIFTKREDSIRLISSHRADKKLEKIYEKYLQEKKNK